MSLVGYVATKDGPLLFADSFQLWGDVKRITDGKLWVAGDTYAGVSYGAHQMAELAGRFLSSNPLPDLLPYMRGMALPNEHFDSDLLILTQDSEEVYRLAATKEGVTMYPEQPCIFGYGSDTLQFLWQESGEWLGKNGSAEAITFLSECFRRMVRHFDHIAFPLSFVDNQLAVTTVHE